MGDGGPLSHHQAARRIDRMKGTDLVSDSRRSDPVAHRLGRNGDDAEAERRVWLRNADRMEAQGLGKLERGHYEEASDLLLDALKIYEAYEHDDGILSAAQYLGIALYELGDPDRAVKIWEEMLSRGWSGPTIYGLLVRHYSERGRIEEVDRLTRRLRETASDRRPGPASQTGPFAAKRPARSGSSGAGTRILLADNDDETRDVLARLLRMEGHAVSEAADGEEALSAVLADPPDLVLLDVYMPKRSGVDVLYQMRQAGVQTPTIVISGVADASMVRDAVVLGAEFMQKPIFIEELRACIREQLGVPAGSAER